MPNRYCTVTGFNTKQLWVYDNVSDTYIDPPKDVLDQIDSKYDWYDWDSKEAALDEILETNPDWLQDTEYTYNAEEVEI